MPGRTRLLASVLAVAAAAGALARAQSELTLCVDVPTNLGASRFQPYQTIRRDGAGAYSIRFQDLAQLSTDVHISGVYYLPDGSFLFCSDIPFTIGATVYQPNDVVRCVPGAPPVYSLYQAGGAGGLGLPAGTAIDGISMDVTGSLLLSFRTPTLIGGGAKAQPSDIVRVDRVTKAMTLFFDWSARTGLSDDVNVNGIEAFPDGDIHISIDVPITSMQGDLYLPGQIIQFTNATGVLSLYWSDPAFSTQSALTDFSFSASPGNTPDGGSVPGTSLSASKSGAQVSMSWGAACSVGASDYAIYEGTIGSWSSHVPSTCTTGGQTSGSVTPQAGDRYFLIVPRNADFEGGYGYRSDGTPRPASSAPCKPEMLVPCN